ncbi:MAG: hypothetical protein IJ523_05725 [Succinivibrionaceae bacterium]|nr:hypothetical protein [Succinivibrionaceae bacterium]
MSGPAKSGIDPYASRKVFALRKAGDLQGAFAELKQCLPQGYPDPVRLSFDRPDERWLAIAAMNVFIDIVRKQASGEIPDQTLADECRNLLRGIDPGSDQQAAARIERCVGGGYRAGGGAGTGNGPHQIAASQMWDAMHQAGGSHQMPSRNFSNAAPENSPCDYQNLQVPAPDLESSPWGLEAAAGWDQRGGPEPDGYRFEPGPAGDPYQYGPPPTPEAWQSYGGPFQGSYADPSASASAESLLQQAMALPKDQQNQLAAQLLSEYRRLSGDTSRDLTLGWRLYRACKEALACPRPDFHQIKSWLNTYFKLNIPRDKRDLLHRCMLIIGVSLHRSLKKLNNPRAEQFRFASFLRIWNPENLGPDYWAKEEGNDFKPLAAEAISRAVGELAKDRSAPPELLEFYLPYARQMAEREPDYIWHTLYLSRILARLGNLQEAEEKLLVVVREYPDVSWAWAELAELVAGRDPDLSVSCCCRALSNPTDEQFKINIHRNLAQLLYAAGDYPRAKNEFLLYLDGKSRPSDEDYAVQNQDWFTGCEPLAEDAFYARMSGRAYELLCSGCERCRAVVGEMVEFTTPDGKKKQKRKLYADLDFDFGDMDGALPASVKEATLLDLSVSEKAAAEHGLAQGDLVELAGRGEGREFSLFSFRKIEGGAEQSEGEDMLPHPVAALVTGVDRKSGNLNCLAVRGVTFRIPTELVPAGTDAGIGSCLHVGLSCRFAKKEPDHPIVNAIAVLGEADLSELPEGIARRFSGRLSVPEGKNFGLVKLSKSKKNRNAGDSVFVSPAELADADLADGDMVQGLACLQYNRKKETWGMAACFVDRVEEGADGIEGNADGAKENGDGKEVNADVIDGNADGIDDVLPSGEASDGAAEETDQQTN